ncbi:MAG TPA: hypothetical protein VFT62_02995 [Mycobacteriales bacterium]|nr:hypothetical protein [Mycobacteriales bacterium]
MTPPRLIALAAAAVLTGGVAIAATAGGGESTPSADRQVAPVTIATAVATPEPTAPTARPRPATRPMTPAPEHEPVSRQPLYPLPARPAYPHPCPPPPIKPGPPVKPPHPVVKAAQLPAPVPVPRHRHVDLAPVRGKGMWLTTWRDTHLDVARVVAQARAAGLQQLWVRTGGTYQGWYGGRFLRTLLPAAHAAGLDVIAWDYPTLSDPVADAQRAARAIRGTFAGQRIDGFSADIEEIAEGTFDSARRVRVYLSRVRAVAGTLPVVATVLRPLDPHLSGRPYRAMAPYVDAFAPMVYWSCNEPGATALSALKPLAKLRPVHLIGQSYDMGPEGGRHGLPTGREIWRFLDVAKRHGAIGASLYVYDQTRRPQWRALAHYPWAATRSALSGR